MTVWLLYLELTLSISIAMYSIIVGVIPLDRCVVIGDDFLLLRFHFALSFFLGYRAW